MKNKKFLIYIFGILSVLIFSLQSLFYYAFSGGVQTKEFITGILFLIISLFSIIALFFIKNSPRLAGKIFIFSGLSALIVMNVRIENILFLFTKSPIGIVMITIPLIFIIIGSFILSFSTND
ncbi:hypothetical protein KKH36_01545 [Patescibacteria group bacterium]|nr:hypothetical protein [Patescibacteria group bacterium]